MITIWKSVPLGLLVIGMAACSGADGGTNNTASAVEPLDDADVATGADLGYDASNAADARPDPGEWKDPLRNEAKKPGQK